MRNPLTILLCIALVGGGGYWYQAAEAVCDVPLTYSIEAIDARFGISESEVSSALDVAVSIWEEQVERDLFVLSEQGDIVIRFIYDERQERVDTEREAQGELESTEGMSSEVQTQYAKLLTSYDALLASYEDDVRAYESLLFSYNSEVASWNEKGGAPEDVYKRLQSTGEDLNREEERLRSLSNELEQLVLQMNRLASEGNALVEEYNGLVDKYNTTYNDTGEFIQGDYGNREISIYQYTSKEELIIVLAHELGHALGIPHVENEDSIMYYHMEEQSLSEGLSVEDLEGFREVCGSGDTVWHTLSTMIRLIRGVFQGV